MKVRCEIELVLLIIEFVLFGRVEDMLDINLWSELMFKPSVKDDMYFYLTVSVFHIDVYIQVKLFIQTLYCLVYFTDQLDFLITQKRCNLYIL